MVFRLKPLRMVLKRSISHQSTLMLMSDVGASTKPMLRWSASSGFRFWLPPVMMSGRICTLQLATSGLNCPFGQIAGSARSRPVYWLSVTPR